MDENGPTGPLRVDVRVTNTGDREGADVVQVFVSDHVASVTPRVQRLKDFQRVELDAGASQQLTFELDPDAFTIIDRHGERVFEPGAFTIRVGDETVELDLRP